MAMRSTPVVNWIFILGVSLRLPEILSVWVNFLFSSSVFVADW